MRNLAQIESIDSDAAFSRIVEAMEQIHDGGFARARRTDDGHKFARLASKDTSVSTGWRGIIGKTHVFRPRCGRRPEAGRSHSAVTDLRIGYPGFRTRAAVAPCASLNLGEDAGGGTEGADKNTGEEHKGKEISRARRRPSMT